MREKLNCIYCDVCEKYILKDECDIREEVAKEEYSCDAVNMFLDECEEKLPI